MERNPLQSVPPLFEQLFRGCCGYSLWFETAGVLRRIYTERSIILYKDRDIEDAIEEVNEVMRMEREP